MLNENEEGNVSGNVNVKAHERGKAPHISEAFTFTFTFTLLP